MEKCVSGKKMYASLELAENALIEARIRFEYASGSGPVAVYRCDDCGRYHLTSKGEMNVKLQQHLMKGKIDREKEANRWLNKLKKRY